MRSRSLQAATEEREPHGEPAPVPEPSEVEVPRALAQEIRRAMKRYPRERSAAIPALWAVQRRYGWCSPEGIEQAAAVMGVTPGYLESVASFYDLFHLEPQGEHQILVCTNISCWLRGADSLLDSFAKAAGTEPGGSSEDGKLFVRGFECIGACDSRRWPQSTSATTARSPTRTRSTRSSSSAPGRTCCRESGSRTAAQPAVPAGPATSESAAIR